ncbi:AMP-binding protein [Nisaea sp.]|jgi:long-chain acyl-CoA synthetase|uniref:AMP-binding protein n=1 Tax=Nisaea sp. TaxID=2024842 RepID=UPI003B51A8F0
MAYEYPDPSVYDTLPKLLRFNAERHPTEVALREKDYGVWTEFTWADYQERVRNLALAMHEAGLRKGDVFAIIGDNNVDWICAELAAQSVGAMTIGFYRDVLEDEIAYLAGYSQAKMAYAEDQEQVDKFLALGDRADSIEKIIYSDQRGMRKFDDPRIVSFNDLVARGAEIHAKSPELYDQLVDAVTGEDVAILCTTSGTTSNPKLAELPHGNFVRHTQLYLKHDPKDSTDEYVSVLPMPWIMEQVYTLGFGLNSRMKVSFPENEETAMQDMREIGPTFLLLAPRVLEQIAADMRARVMDAGPLTQWIFEKGVALGTEAVEQGSRSWLADTMLFGALRDRLGFSNVRSAATGGAAMGPETFKLFLAMGVPLKQLYGQTELLGAYTLQDGKEIDVDTVGVPFEGCEVKIIDADTDGVGEIVTRHPNMFRGFYKNAEATKADMKDGWMHTGDAGFFDDKGRLTVIDRVKDIAQTRTGTKFSPQYIENKLKFSPYIGEAVILGAGQDYLTAIICVRFSIVSKWAEKARIPFTSYTNLSDRPEIYELIRGEIAHVNESLPETQKIRKFLLLYKELDADDGELTRTRKVRRSVIAERYGPIIEALYGDGDRAEMNSEVTFEDGRKGNIQASMKIMEVDGAAAPALKKAG